MMIAEVGDIIVVKGMSMAIAEDGPMPGRTPTRVPIIHPTKAQNKLVAPKAELKPWSKRSKENDMPQPPHYAQT
jgi:hypothetical protein